MRESKAELTDRLRREGRLEAFKKRREELKAEGVPAKQAWYQAATEFPPPAVTTPAQEAPSIDLQSLKGKSPVSVVLAATWAFENLDADWVLPADAPSAGAWSLREWARSNVVTRTEFYRMFAAKIVLPPQLAAHIAKEASDRQHQNLMKKMFGPFDLKNEATTDDEEDEKQRMERIFGKSVNQEDEDRDQGGG